MDAKKLWDDKGDTFRDLQARMQADEDMFNLSAYEAKTADDNPLPHAISITLNDIAVFDANVEASLGSAEEQVKVESEDKNLDTSYIEEVINRVMGAANQRLENRGMVPLNAFFDHMTCRRGRTAAKVVCQMIDDVFDVDIVPWDTMSVRYAIGKKGLIWGGAEFERDADAINDEYPGAELKEKTGKVRDMWDGKENAILINDKPFEEQPNPFGYPPVVVRVVPMGALSTKIPKLQGESIIFMIRDLFPRLEQLASFFMTLSSKHVRNALVTFGKGIDYEQATAPGAVTALDKDDKPPQPIDFGRLEQEALWIHDMIEKRIQKATISDFESGIFQQGPWSSIALITVFEGRDRIFFPRLGTRGKTNEGIAYMAIDQMKKIGGTLDLNGFQIDTGKLEGEYTIKYEYFIKDPALDAARAQVAAGSGLPEYIQWRDIQKLPNLGEVIQYRYWEQAAQMSPTIRQLRTLLTLTGERVEPGLFGEVEAKLLELEMGVTLDQMMSGQGGQTPTTQEPTQKMPIYPGPSGQSPAMRTANLQATPQRERANG